MHALCYAPIISRCADAPNTSISDMYFYPKVKYISVFKQHGAMSSKIPSRALRTKHDLRMSEGTWVWQLLSCAFSFLYIL